MHEDEFEDLVNYSPSCSLANLGGSEKCVVWQETQEPLRAFSPATQHRVGNTVLHFHRAAYEHIAKEYKGFHYIYSNQGSTGSNGQFNPPRVNPSYLIRTYSIERATVHFQTRKIRSSFPDKKASSFLNSFIPQTHIKYCFISHVFTKRNVAVISGH